jgi:HEAT repeat protein
LEKQLLPDAGLKPIYDKIVWVYVYRDFKKNAEDLKAERISLRFSVTSWPKLLLVDPGSLQVLRSTGRTVPSFVRAVNSARVQASNSPAAVDRVRQADARAAELEKQPSVKRARSFLDDADIVVRFRALRVLADKEPEFIAARAESLLKVTNDPFRYEVCQVLAKTGSPTAKRALEDLARRPARSRNPNVLRIRAVEALASCGDGESIEVIGPFTQGSYLNTLTTVAVNSLSAIAERHRDTRDRTRAILVEAFPVPSPEANQSHARYCTRLAKTVHSALQKATERQITFPEVYTAETRRQLIKRWQE